MRYIRLEVGNAIFHVRPPARSARAAEEVAAALPSSLEFIQEMWSGAFVSSLGGIRAGAAVPRDEAEPYQYPGGVYLEGETGRLSICYGPGRLLDGFGPLHAALVGEIVEPVEQVTATFVRAQFDGPLRVGLSAVEAPLPPAEPVAPRGTRIELTLAGARAAAVLLDEEVPTLAKSFASALPAGGTATNTHSSGPLMRFWSEVGGTQGRTPLTYNADEAALAQATLYPGRIYYLPKPTHAGLRITLRTPAIMRSPTGGPGLTLLPLGQLTGDWTEFAAIAERLQLTGAKPMSISLS